VGKKLGNSWRIAGDCDDWKDVITAINTNAPLFPYAGPGGWNDPDIMIGSSNKTAYRITEAQSRTMFSLWSVMAAPLLIGSNIIDLTDWDYQTYTNKDIIAIDQDKLGQQGQRIVGGNLGNDRNIVYATMELCNDENKSQLWKYSNGKILNDHQCLRIDQHSSYLIYEPCSEKNLPQSPHYLFDFKNEKLVHHSQECISLLPDGQMISLQPCSKDQVLIKNNTHEKNQFKISHGNQCLTATYRMQASTYNIWAKPLSNGGWAVHFINIDTVSQKISCDMSCFKKMSFPSSGKIKITDLWSKDSINFDLGNIFSSTCGPSGGSNTYSFVMNN